MYSPWHDWDSTLVTNRVMDSGIHRISLVYTVPTLETMSMMLTRRAKLYPVLRSIRPSRYFQRFTGSFMGVSYDCETPPPRVLLDS